MPRIIETTVHMFKELSEDIQKQVIEDNRYRETKYNDWYECTLMRFKEVLETIGFYEVDISFSGFSSQGDGASFTGKYSYEKGFLSKIKKEYPQWNTLHRICEEILEENKRQLYKIYFELYRLNHRYSHEKTVDITDYECNSAFDWDKPDDNGFSDSEDKMLSLSRQLMELIYSALEKEYNHLTSDEYIKWLLEGSDNEYTEDGELFK